MISAAKARRIESSRSYACRKIIVHPADRRPADCDERSSARDERWLSRGAGAALPELRPSLSRGTTDEISVVLAIFVLYANRIADSSGDAAGYVRDRRSRSS